MGVAEGSEDGVGIEGGALGFERAFFTFCGLREGE